jgi:hypothetical protein
MILCELTGCESMRSLLVFPTWQRNIIFNTCMFFYIALNLKFKYFANAKLWHLLVQVLVVIQLGNFWTIVQVILPKFVILGKSIPSPNSSQLQNISYQNTPGSEELCTMVLASFKQFVCRDSYNQSFPRPLDCRISLSLYTFVSFVGRQLYCTSTLRTLPSSSTNAFVTRPTFHCPRTLLESWIMTTSPTHTFLLSTSHFCRTNRLGK